MKTSQFKDMWDMNEGTTFIPWNQFPKDYSHLTEEAIVDEDTLPPSMKGELKYWHKKSTVIYQYILMKHFRHI